MKELTKIQSIIFIAGGILMVIGAGCFAFNWHQRVVCWIFALGAVMFTLMQARQQYLGKNFIIKRLKKIQGLTDFLFVLSAILMIDSAYIFLAQFFGKGSAAGYNNYIQYVYNKWVVVLIIAAILEAYTTHRIASELKKDN